MQLPESPELVNNYENPQLNATINQEPLEEGRVVVDGAIFRLLINIRKI